ncbi:MAG: hypothetical protein ABIM99_01200 [Candidatus Dojkabacteria bacterium]
MSQNLLIKAGNFQNTSLPRHLDEKNAQKLNDVFAALNQIIIQRKVVVDNKIVLNEQQYTQLQCAFVETYCLFLTHFKGRINFEVVTLFLNPLRQILQESNYYGEDEEVLCGIFEAIDEKYPQFKVVEG